jgi:uncharacterized protein YicC (UPF0701 family)
MGDFTRNSNRALDRDAPTLTREEVEALGHVAHQKDDGRRAETSRALALETPSERLARLTRAVERMGAEARTAIRPHLRVIEQRIQRAERRVPADPETIRRLTGR